MIILKNKKKKKRKNRLLVRSAKQSPITLCSRTIRVSTSDKFSLELRHASRSIDSTVCRWWYRRSSMAVRPPEAHRATILNTVSPRGSIDNSIGESTNVSRVSREPLHPLSKFPFLRAPFVCHLTQYFFFFFFFYLSLSDNLSSFLSPRPERLSHARESRDPAACVRVLVRGDRCPGKFTGRGTWKFALPDVSPSARVTCPASCCLVRKRRTKIPSWICRRAISPPREPRPCTTSTASAVDKRFRGGDPEGRPGGKFGLSRDTSRRYTFLSFGSCFVPSARTNFSDVWAI